ncbi:unnamed protein product [Calypogeia fissa]
MEHPPGAVPPPHQPSPAVIKAEPVAAAAALPLPLPPPPPTTHIYGDSSSSAALPPGVGLVPPQPRREPEVVGDEVMADAEDHHHQHDSSSSPQGSPHETDVAMHEYEVSEESKKAQKRHEEKVQQLLMRRRANALAVPTNDGAVRSRLRSLQQPITLFGEREMERRDRLRAVMARLDADGELEKLLQAQEPLVPEVAAMGEDLDGAEEVEEPEPYQLFYTEGSNELLKARTAILRYSLPRSGNRIVAAKRRREDPDEDEDAEFGEVLQGMAQTSMECSEIGDERPLSGCALSPCGQLLATSSWSGNTKIWEIPAVKRTAVLKGHTERVTGVAFHPEACRSISPSAANIVTGAADRTAIAWSLDGAKLRTFEGHLDRLARVAFHPSGAYLGTASFDKTWRLWDVSTGIELLLQEGHSRAVYGIAFQQDGALAASCGLDGLSRVWDLRTGKSVLALEGHVKPVLGIDFSPNGYHLATGSEDHTCRIWDLRKKKCLYIIPAHSSIISQVKFEPSEGYFLATGSYDSTTRIWSGKDFKAVKTLAGHEGKIMGVDVMADGQYIATVSYDRTIKLWSHFNQ